MCEFCGELYWWSRDWRGGMLDGCGRSEKASRGGVEGRWTRRVAGWAMRWVSEVEVDGRRALHFPMLRVMGAG